MSEHRIDDQTIDDIEILAKLSLSPAEREQAQSDLSQMLAYIDRLNELDTEGVEPMSHAFSVSNVFREDIVTNGDGSADTLANAPAAKEGMYQVPRTFGE